MSPLSNWATLIINLKREFPRFKIIEKENSKFMNFLYVVFLMKYWNKDFMTKYTTTVYQTVYMPKNLIATNYAYQILRHEAIHMKDSKGWRALYFFPTYLFLLPIGLCMRAYWEYRAYVESMKVQFELTNTISSIFIDHIVSQFTTSSYLWMFPFPKTLKKLLNKEKQKIIGA